jgi:hypothetical protein
MKNLIKAMPKQHVLAEQAHQQIRNLYMHRAKLDVLSITNHGKVMSLSYPPAARSLAGKYGNSKGS